MRRPRAVLLALLCIAACGAVAGPSAGAAELPDLVADEPNRVELSLDATAKDEPSLLVRFDGFIHNKGPGALEIRGTRDSTAVPMTVVQRTYGPNRSSPEDRASSAQLEFSDADGHHHWHLQRAARYSLVFDGDRTQTAAPSEKVGFCLQDTEPADVGVGPARAVYTDAALDNCQQLRPNALGLYEGISAGWRDIYTKGLAFQWVDVSDVQPGSYWLRVDVDPDDVVAEADEVNVPAFSAHPVVVPGYKAVPVQAQTLPGRAVALTLPAEAWREYDGPALPSASFAIVDPPDHGTLSGSGPEVTYTPEPGWRGIDTFSYTATDPSSTFPRHPAVATATIAVGEPVSPTVTISGAPDSVVAGTRVQLTATVVGDEPQVTWSATAGTIDADGLYAAPDVPPAGGTATVTARSATGATATVTLAITAKTETRPKPDPPDPPGPPAGAPRPKRPALSQISTLRMGRVLIAKVRPNVGGRVRVTAWVRGRRAGACVAQVKGGRSFTCRLTLARSVALRAPIRIVAGLRAGRTLTRRIRAAAPIAAASPRAAAANATAAGKRPADGAWGNRLFCALAPQ